MEEEDTKLFKMIKDIEHRMADVRRVAHDMEAEKARLAMSLGCVGDSNLPTAFVRLQEEHDDLKKKYDHACSMWQAGTRRNRQIRLIVEGRGLDVMTQLIEIVEALRQSDPNHPLLRQNEVWENIPVALSGVEKDFDKETGYKIVCLETIETPNHTLAPGTLVRAWRMRKFANQDFPDQLHEGHGINEYCVRYCTANGEYGWLTRAQLFKFVEAQKEV